MKLKQIERSRKGDRDQGSVGPSVQMPASGEQTLSWWFQLWWYRSDQYRSMVGRSIQINSDQSNTEAALDTRRSIQRLWTNAKLIELGPNMVLHLFNHHVYCLHPPLPAPATSNEALVQLTSCQTHTVSTNTYHMFLQLCTVVHI